MLEWGYNIGDLVIFMNVGEHKRAPEYHPKVGTIGRIIKISQCSQLVQVQWPQGTTSKKDLWWACCDKDILPHDE